VRAFELEAEVDEERRLSAVLPGNATPGRVRVIVLVPEADDATADETWMRLVAHEWAQEIADEREDIYTVSDGEPVDAAR